MSAKLTWFKFTPGDWLSGKITMQSHHVQADFIRLCCRYWNKRCEFSMEDAESEYPETINQMIRARIVKTNGEFIGIEFLDEQMNEIAEASKKQSDRAKERWKDKPKADATAMPDNATAMPPHKSGMVAAMPDDAEKKRKEENRKEEKKNNTDFMFDLQRDEIWIEQTCMALQTDKTTIKIKLPEAAALFDSRGEDHANRRLFQSHFVNWLREDLKKPKPAKAKQTQPTELLNLIDQQLNNASNDNGHLHIG